MRARDLIGVSVLDADGKRLGIVIDLRCVQDGPLRGAMNAPRVSALVISRGHTGSLLGYHRNRQQGPWLVRAIVQLMHRHMLVVDWSHVEGYDGHIQLGRTFSPSVGNSRDYAGK